MKYLNLFCLDILSFMFFPATSYAQKKAPAVMHWQLAATLPVSGDQATSLGVAGPVAGIHNDVLFIGGGANFPVTMPWLGGKKKYYDDLYVFVKRKGKITPLKNPF